MMFSEEINMIEASLAHEPLKTLKHQQVVQTSYVATLTPIQMVVSAVCLVLVLWLAYRIGTVILRVAAGFLFLGLIAYIIYHFFLQ